MEAIDLVNLAVFAVSGAACGKAVGLRLTSPQRPSLNRAAIGAIIGAGIFPVVGRMFWSKVFSYLPPDAHFLWWLAEGGLVGSYFIFLLDAFATKKALDELVTMPAAARIEFLRSRGVWGDWEAYFLLCGLGTLLGVAATASYYGIVYLPLRWVATRFL